MATKIFWTRQERELLEERMIELFSANPILRSDSAIASAQAALPPERRRVVKAAAYYRMKPWIDECRAESKRQRNIPQPQPQPEIVPPPPPEVRSLFDQILDLLADSIVERIELRMQEFPGAQQAYSLRIKHNPTPPTTDRAPRTGVLVIGLLPSQATRAIGCFPNLELTCLTSEEALKREPLRRAHTILMTKFISHSVQDRYRKAQSLQLCNGGVTELIEMLGRIQ